MVIDGTWCGTTLDILYIFATNNATTAALNLCSTNYGITSHGMTFTVNRGWTGDGTSTYLDSGFTPSLAAGNCAVNSCTLAVYNRLAQPTPIANFTIGAPYTNGSEMLSLLAYWTNGSTYYEVNGAASAYETGVVSRATRAQGMWTITRTGASADALYYNSNNTAGITGTLASQSLPDFPVWILALDQGGVPGAFETNQVAAFWLGAGVTSATSKLIADHINTFMTTVGANVY